MRGLVIAGTHSGCGKTTVTLGILAALKKKGFIVQPFKAGPDFIDAGLHRLVLDKPSRNLDQWMCGRDYVIDSFNRYSANADISVIEGVMGMHDGDFSTAHLAGLLQAPVVFVVDAYGMAESAGAVVEGFTKFGIQTSKFKVKFAGVIFNRVASENHYKRLKDSVLDVPVLGYLPREASFEIPHRHLGLTVAEENPLSGENIERLADTVLKYIDVDALMQRCEYPVSFSSFQGEERGGDGLSETAAGDKRKFCIAVAYDKAFSFYYEDNLDLLRDAGAELIRFSPLADAVIPADADAVYIGGGYPELHSDALSRNVSMLQSIREWADAGRALYAECGGLMYLSQGIRDFDNKLFPMAGVFPFGTRMMKKPRLGYREIILNEECILGTPGEKCRGHEFHYSEILEVDSSFHSIYNVSDSRNVKSVTGGYRYKNTLASYIHIHFGSNLKIAERFAAFIKGSN